MAVDDPQRLTEKGARIISRGGADGVDEEGMIILEILKRAPGMSKADLQTCFVALRMEYGENALEAIQSGHVQIEPRKPQ
jgi:hypothetical protein